MSPDRGYLAGVGRALVVDDDADIRLLVRSVFELRGWAVDEAVDGDDALARTATDYDVVLLDHKMPGVTGDEVALRFRHAGYDRPIIFYSAHLTHDLERRLRDDVDVEVHVVAKTDFARLVDLIDHLSTR